MQSHYRAVIRFCHVSTLYTVYSPESFLSSNTLCLAQGGPIPLLSLLGMSKFVYFQLFKYIFISSPDNRREPCYRVAPNASACTNSVASAVMKSDCCCSRFGKAWGNTCEICPALGTSMYA